MALEFDLNRDAPAAVTTDCVVIGAFADNTLTPSGRALDEASGGRIAALLDRGDISGKTGKTAMLHDLPGITSPRILVVGLGEEAKFARAAVPQGDGRCRARAQGRSGRGCTVHADRTR